MRQFIWIILLFPTLCNAQYVGTGSVTKGFATQTNSSNLYPCTGGRITNIGTIKSTDNLTWTVPSITNFTNPAFPFASDLYNSCNGATFGNETLALNALNGNDIVTIDSDGELITAYIFADNYFEMYINGVPVGKDNVPYTQFNSNIVRFKVKRPFTIAMQLVDWEENLGLGSEANKGVKYHAGDGGMVAVFKDVNQNIIAKTDSDWKAQTYYTAPINDLSCVSESANLRLSTNCSTLDVNDGSNYYGLHWSKPNNWMNKDFDDSNWPLANIYTNSTVGVDNKPAYTNFTSIFDATNNDAQFIWSSNLILDNDVLVRKTVPAITGLLDENNNFGVQLFPNPLSNELNIQIKDIQDVQHINITNQIGSVMYSSNTFTDKILLNDFKKGVYFLSITFQNKIFTSKFIIH